jgi:hypothetical protein
MKIFEMTELERRIFALFEPVYPVPLLYIVSKVLSKAGQII